MNFSAHLAREIAQELVEIGGPLQRSRDRELPAPLREEDSEALARFKDAFDEHDVRRPDAQAPDPHSGAALGDRKRRAPLSDRRVSTRPRGVVRIDLGDGNALRHGGST
jgi:hypothetical protein